MSFDTKYRPHTFADVIGQQSAVSVLRELLLRGEVFQKSYVFSGPSGTGKTTTARILARAMLCEDLDPETAEPCNQCPSCSEILERGESFAFKEMDAANNSGADNIRRIVEGLEYYTLGGGDRKIYLVDECHRLSPTSMDALLKPMEDNVPGTKNKRLVCLFCTTEPQKLRGTIKSRCMVFGIKDPTRDEVIARLRLICDAEGIEAEDDALDMIFSFGQGHIRDMVSALERVSRVGPVTVANTSTQLGLDVVAQFYGILMHLKTDPTKSLEEMGEALTQVDPDAVYEGMAEAALAAYKASKGILVGLSHYEKILATELSQALPDDVLLLIAHKILGSPKKTDKSTLLCEIMMLHHQINGGTMALSSPNAQVPIATVASVSAKPVAQSSKVPEAVDVEEANRKMAELAISYGAKAARGKPDRPGVQEDPLVTHTKNRTSVRDDLPMLTPLTTHDYSKLKDGLASKTNEPE